MKTSTNDALRCSRMHSKKHLLISLQHTTPSRLELRPIVTVASYYMCQKPKCSSWFCKLAFISFHSFMGLFSTFFSCGQFFCLMSEYGHFLKKILFSKNFLTMAATLFVLQICFLPHYGLVRVWLEFDQLNVTCLDLLVPPVVGGILVQTSRKEMWNT